MDEENSISEDEWTSIKKRFKSEGLEWEGFESTEKVLQVFRWLVDAEANLKASRNINEKLRKQHEEEKKEWDKYSEHLRHKCEDRVKEIEKETKVLKDDLEALLSGTQAVANILLQEGLEDVANSSLGDQIAYLLVERAQLMEDLQQANGNAPSEAVTDSRTHLKKVKTERDILKNKNEEMKTQINDMSERITFLENSTKRLEDHNESLSFKLSETLFEIEEKERQLFNREQNGSRYGPKKDSISEPCSISCLPTTKASSEKETPPKMERTNRRSSEFLQQQLNSLDSLTGGESPQRLNSLLDSQIFNSKTHLTHLNDVKKLQNEVERLKMNYLKAGSKYEDMLRKYETLKLTSVNQREMQNKENEMKVEKLKDEMMKMKNEFETMDEANKVGEELRKKIEKDLQQLLNQRQEEITRKKGSEIKVKEVEEQNKILQQQLKCSQDENRKLIENVRELSVAKILS